MKFFVAAIGLMCVLAPAYSGQIRGLDGGIRGLDGGIRRLNRHSRATSDQEVPIVRSESVVKPDGYNYGYETGNGISADESGSLKKVGDGEAINVQGQFRYPSPEGQNIALSYVADENGFQPQGDHLPVPPPIPEAIVRALKYIEAHPPPVESSYKKP